MLRNITNVPKYLLILLFVLTLGLSFEAKAQSKKSKKVSKVVTPKKKKTTKKFVKSKKNKIKVKSVSQHNSVVGKPEGQTITKPLNLPAEWIPFLDTLNPVLREVLSNSLKYNFEVIYTQINRDSLGVPTFVNYHLGLDSTHYFYCASTAKLFAATLALDKSNKLGIPNLNDAQLTLDSSFICQRSIKLDTTFKNKVTIHNCIRKMFLVSDNDAFNRMYDFITPQGFREQLGQTKFLNTRIVHRLDLACKGEPNNHLPALKFYNNQFQEVYKQDSSTNFTTQVHPLGQAFGGTSYCDDRKIVYKPKDFTMNNYLSLNHVHTLLQDIVFNDQLSAPSFKLKYEDQNFLMLYLGMLPKQSKLIKYDTLTFHNGFKKFNLFGGSRKTNTDTTQSFNIVGMAYGYITDVSYIVDYSKKIEYLLSVRVFANSNGLIGSGKYEYDKVGLPVMKSIGRSIYNYEVKRERKYPPNLNRWKGLKESDF